MGEWLGNQQGGSQLTELSLPEGPEWLQRLREQAQSALLSSGLPDSSWEHWRHNNLSAFARHELHAPSSSGDPGDGLAGLDDLLSTESAPRLIFIDGLLDLERSRFDLLPSGINLTSLTSGLRLPREAKQPAGLARSADLQSDPIMAMNTALLRDGLFVHVQPGSSPDRPLLVVNYATSQCAGRICYPRLWVDVAQGAELQLVEWHGGANRVDYVSAPVSEFFVAEGAEVGVARISEEGDEGQQIGAVRVEAQSNSRVSVHSYVCGGEQVRVELSASLQGGGGEAYLSGFHLSDGRSFVEHHSAVYHHCEQTRSRQFFKGVLEGRSVSLFDGIVHVDSGAQKTDAEQQNRNLVLSPMALAHSIPRLEIYADDVRCSHGATAGQLDEAAIFYMRARGIEPQTAQALLTRAFAAQAIEFAPVVSAQEYELARLDDFLSLVTGGSASAELPQSGN